MLSISIIVPIYNVEKYLNRCIDSILNQTFEDFELILVDDGSTDRCGEICKEYVVKDNRVRYIYQNNKGVSEARNLGVENSVGKYIQFVDADDYIDKNFLEVVINRFKNDNSDIVFVGFYNEYNNGEVYKQKYYSEYVISTNIRYYCLELHKRDLFGYICCKVFKSSIIKKFNLKFNKNMQYCEDELFTCEYCKYIKNISIENIPMYHYINYKGSRENLSSKKNNNIFNTDKLFNSWVELLGNYDQNYLENKAYTIIKFLYFNEIWSNESYKIRKDNIKRIKQTSIMEYINSRESLNKKPLVKNVRYQNILLFKILFRIYNKLNIEL